MRTIALTILLQLFCRLLFGQNTIDSLQHLVNSGNSDTIELKNRHLLCWNLYNNGEADRARNCLNGTFSLAGQLIQSANQDVQKTSTRIRGKCWYLLGNICYAEQKYPEAINAFNKASIDFAASNLKHEEVIAISYSGDANFAIGNYSKAIDAYYVALNKAEQLGDKDAAAYQYGCIALIYQYLGANEEALANYKHALKIRQELGDQREIANCYNNLGSIYAQINQLNKAREYYQGALAIFNKLADSIWIGNSLINLATTYEQDHQDELALNNYFEAARIFTKANCSSCLATAFTNIGLLYRQQGKFTEAHQYLQMALQNYTHQKNISSIARLELETGVTHLNEGAHDKAKHSLIRSRDLARSIQDKHILVQVYGQLAITDSVSKQFASALTNYRLSIAYRDSLENEESKKSIVKSQISYEYQKRAAVIKAEHEKELQKEKVISQEKSYRQNLVILFFAILSIVIGFFSIYFFRSMKVSKKQKQLIEEKSKEVEAQKKEIEEKNKDLLDSIRYARRIQRSLLPSEKFIQRIIRGRNS
jgi:tetratricopeptide (TPR) repeat protein